MLVDPNTLAHDLDRLEEIEKASLRFVVQAVYDFRQTAADIFRIEKDLSQDKAEDASREALDRMGVSKVDQRLYGKVDYKRARYVFHPNYAIKQALYVDSKAEKQASSARIQVAQLTMRVRQMRAGTAIDVPGTLPPIIDVPPDNLLTTTIFVKYHYKEDEGQQELQQIIIAVVPHLLLQDRYNPTAEDTIWVVGPDAPSLSEEFRTRLSFSLLETKRRWRVQHVLMPPHAFAWEE